MKTFLRKFHRLLCWFYMEDLLEWQLLIDSNLMFLLSCYDFISTYMYGDANTWAQFINLYIQWVQYFFIILLKIIASIDDKTLKTCKSIKENFPPSLYAISAFCLSIQKYIKMYRKYCLEQQKSELKINNSREKWFVRKTSEKKF